MSNAEKKTQVPRLKLSITQIKDWEFNLGAKLEANAELSKSMLGSELQGEDFTKKMVDLVNQRKKYFAQERARAKRNKKSGKRRKQMARRGLHTNIDKDDFEGSDEDSEQDDSVTENILYLLRYVKSAENAAFGWKANEVASKKLKNDGKASRYHWQED
ncbi:hypothetical protein Tco_1002210 [Tanacetum coccineum]|uniref:Uncharacterized protein n=1 Tax=Tanacetum coccineum TaxID=301880 RepID=A0ABQ5F7H0_9ASTR